MNPEAWIAFADDAGALWVAALRGVDGQRAVTDLPLATLPQRPEWAVILRSGHRLTDVRLEQTAAGSVAVQLAQPIDPGQWQGARLEVTARS